MQLFIVLLLFSTIGAIRIKLKSPNIGFLSCTTGNVIDVRTATYKAKNCEDPNAFSTIIALANGKQTYELDINDDTFTTSTCASDVRETLTLVYNCISEVTTTTIAQGETQSLTCNSGQYITVTKAWYINDANTCYDANALTTASGLCDIQTSCTITANDATFTGSTCTSETENLQISYACNSASGATFTYWGSADCGGNALLLYTGQMVGSSSTKTGGGDQYLCMPATPTPSSNSDGTVTANRGKIYGTELQVGAATLPFQGQNDYSISCAMCHFLSAKTYLTVPGKATCPDDFTLLYSGYLVSEKSLSSRNSNGVVCLPEMVVPVTGSSASGDSLAYPVQVKCGSLDCSTFTNNAELKCAVCYK